MRDYLLNKILDLKTTKNLEILRGVPPSSDFETLALEVFQYQYKYNVFYHRYCSLLGKDLSKISTLEDIPFLPIQFFKTQKIQTGEWESQSIFSSSGTTGITTSRHYVRDIDLYKKLCCSGFETFYGQPKGYCFLGLLPSYLERDGSSLIIMVDDFIKKSKYKQNGFFLNNIELLFEILIKNCQNSIPTVLFGVTFALLDFVEKYSIDFPNLIVIETGGMKGRRREMIREELHQILQTGFGTKTIHSEYGMTELMSQGYSQGLGKFECSPTLRILQRDVNDPLSILPASGRLGVLNIIDLGNIDTCSFIATDDLGRVYPDNSFEVLGRLDNSDIRGCNLLVGSI